MRTLFRDIEDFRAKAEQYRELDAEHMLVLTRGVEGGRLSGVPVSSRGAEVFEVRDGKVTRFVVYFDCDRALADLGLEA
jgi:ketosteroid isomerase-like protein